ncbi:major head protein [Mycobacterium phage Shipwreck]|uniref:Major capsid protein n=2 Tax=Caudoviricetes TaxID=2731619 RepID=A0A143FPL6_9CAUD|nr:major head protein [Mycobacterium phage Shipwreck]AMW63825.1 major capsid protein [Mycobacterium phage Shipwreck]ASD53636.1 major capsid protein [Mycobacterium phage Bogie]
MSVQFPPGAPSLSGDVLSINRFLKDTPWVLRALRTIADEQLVGDKLLTANITTESGSIGYEQNESIYADRPPQPVTPGGEYPVTPISTGPASTANTVNWGNDALITDVSISRQKYDVVGRAFRKLMNSHIMAVDTVALSAVASSVTQNTNAIASWKATSGVKILRDLMRAATELTKLKQGYRPNAVFVEPDVFANVVSDDELMKLLPREYPGVESTPVSAGLSSAYMRQIGGFTFITSPNAPTLGKALLCDTTVLGGFANETVPAPGYVSAENGLQVKTMREDQTDGWRIRCRRITVPVVLEPGAGWWINGVNA